MAPLPLRKKFVGCKTGRSWEKTYHFQGAEKTLQQQFPKVGALRQGGSGACSQEDMCKTLNGAEGNVKASWS